MISPPFSIDKLLAIMTRLRDPDEGCPWDTQQEFSTIAPYTIEEAYEVAEAIAQNDHDALKDELGDLLFQVVFHAQMAHEENSFDFSDVVDSICDKMLRRHPHVFGDAEAHSEHDQTIAWEAQKEEERAQKDKNGQMASTLDGVAKALPALMRAEKLQKRAARVGFDWPTSDEVFDKINEEEYLEIIINKTACLFAAAIKTGALLAGAEKKTANQLYEYGMKLGIAFQIVDDLLDVMASEKELGKPSGNDMLEGVYTLPVIRALKGPNGEALKDLLSNPISSDKRDEALILVRSDEAIISTIETALGFTHEAQQSLKNLPNNPTAEILKSTCTILANQVNTFTK